MLAKITLYDGTVYKIASQTVDTEDGIYLGRIKDELSLVSAMQEAGNAPATINLTIINYDNFIPHNKDLWAAEVLLTNENNISWRGKINFCNFDSDGNLYVTASEKTAPELELQLPDEVRQVYTVDEDFHQSSVTMTIPLVIGGTTSNPITLPTILIDKTRGIYLICVGEIRSIVRVLNGAEPLPSSAYTAYTGTADQEENAGFAYVQIGTDYRLNSDGTYAEINVEVVGLKLGDFTEEECRNGALFLYYFLTTAATGINGWGCGIDPSEIDTASFQSAITLCNQLGYKLDGIMWLRQSAQSWIDQICQAIHGKYSINANGKRSLFIDYAGNASKKTFTASNMRVDRYGKNSYTSVVYNKGVLSYDYNPITGLFMQSAQYENADSIAQIGEQKFIGESYLIKDATTALAVLEYTCKRSQIAAEAIEFDTDAVETNLRAGDIITINRPDLNLNNALYQIQSISTTDFQSSIIAVKFDTSVFNVTGTASTVNWGNERDITPALTPAQATNLLLSTGFDINPDGTGTPYISGTFTVPEGGWLAAAVQYGISTNPLNWTEMALITEGRFKLSPVNVDTVYSIRVRMITATGHSSFITGVITATGDTIPPSKPTISAKATDRTVTIQCGLDTPPADMGGFQIYRKKSTDSESAYTLIATVAANRGYAAFSDYVDEYVTYNYKAKSYDRSGNLSLEYSEPASVTVTGIQANDVAATALAMPTGSILRLSAKNCTTASIAEANGVKDVSGRGNHGRAYGGVEVVKDAEMGDCFSFDASASSGLGCLNFIEHANIFVGLSEISLSIRFKADTLEALASNTYSVLFLIYETTVSAGNIFAAFSVWPDGHFATRLAITSGSGNPAEFVSDIGAIEINKEYILTLSSNFTENKTEIYLDAQKLGEIESGTGTITTAPSYFVFGSHINNATYKNYRFRGKISDVRIYPRALSASEIKTIYMFPDDVTFGQLTADLIGANIIKAQNLIQSEAVITQTAQIAQAVVNNLNVSGNATFTNGLTNTLNSAKADATAKVKVVTDNIYTSGTTTINGGKITTETITASQISVSARKPIGCIVEYCTNYLPINSTSKTYSVADLSGNALAGAYTGAIYDLRNTLLGHAMRSSTGFSTGVFSNSTDFTLSLWLKNNDTSNHGAFYGYFYNGSTQKGYLWAGGSTQYINLSLETGGEKGVFANAQDGNVYHYVLTRSGTTIKSYKNGVLSNTITATANGAINKITIGNSFINTNNIAIWNRALTADEVMALYKAGTDTESGQITADRIATDAIKSRNYSGSTDGSAFSTYGSYLDMANGNFVTPFFRLRSSSTNKDCQIGAWTIKANGAFEADSWATGTSVSEKPVITVNGTFAGGLSYTELNHFCYSAYALYDPSGRYQDKTYVYLTPRGLTFERGDPPSGTVKFGIGEVDVVNPTTGSSTRWGLYVTGNAYCTNGTWTSCDENVKRDIKDVSTLAKLKEIRVKKFKYSQKAIQEKEWLGKQALIEKENAKKGIKTEEEKMPEFKDDENAPDYIMAMAGEFNKAFGVDNGNEEEINYTNAIGVALRSIQELAEIVDSQKAEIAELKALLKTQQDSKSELTDHFNELTKEPTDEDELIEPSFDELLKDEGNQQEEQKK